MRQEHFVRAHQDEWAALSRVLDALEKRQPCVPDSLPEACRRVSQHLALARHRGYSADLVTRLHELAMRSHQQLYRRQLDVPTRLRALLQAEVPQAIRREWRLVLLGHLLFYGPLLAALLSILAEPGRVHAVLDPLSLAAIEEMYDPAGDHFLRERAADSDLLMFGYYVWNNIGIGFRTFASGALLGLGPAFFLGFNGVQIGAVMAHLYNVGSGGTLSAFVIGHGSFELTAIVLSGAAGARLGLALLAPGRHTRAEALRRAALRALPVVQGAGLMLLLAAVIEAFWSSSTLVPATVKYAVGGVLWVVVYTWLLLGGRRADR